LRFAFAQRAFCAAAILLRLAAEIVLLGFPEGPLAFFFAHRAFCARLIFLRAAADRVRRWPPDFELPNITSAAPYRSTSFFARSSSFFKCRTTSAMFSIAISLSVEDDSRIWSNQEKRS
jgi:hypothetical protein